MFLVAPVYADVVKKNQKSIPAIVKTNSTPVTVRSFNKKAIQAYSEERDFQYDESIRARLSLWQRLWIGVRAFIGNLFASIFGNKTSGTIFKWGLLALAVAFLTYVVLKLLGIDIVNVLRGKSKAIEIPYSESLENIHEINFDTEIDNAVTNRNYRLAVRLLYLRSLKQLSDAQLIHWQLEKTNNNYLNELTDAGQRQQFSLLTSRFEYVWYGNFPIDGQSFQNINALFTDFKRRLR